MSLANFVNITITADTVGASRAGFGVPLILSATAAFAERIRFYASLAEVAEDFAVTTGPEYLAATALFSQSPRPTSVAIGRSALPPTQVYTMSLLAAPTVGTPITISVKADGATSTDISVTPLADIVFAPSDVTTGTDVVVMTAHGMTTGNGPYRVIATTTLPAPLAIDTNYWIIAPDANSIKFATSYANAIALTAIDLTTQGTDNHLLTRDANDVMVAQLVDRLNSVVGNNYIAAQVAGGGDTDTFTVTADAAGEWVSLQVNPAQIISNQTHVDPGVATDLAAIALENNAWYCLITLYNSNAYVLAAAAWIETQQKIYMADVSDTTVVTATVLGSDTADDLHTLAYARTAAWYHPAPASMLGAAIAGRCLPIDPGGESWTLKNLAGVAAVVLTSTHRTNLVNKAANSYQTVGGSGRTFNGMTADGDFIDVQRGLDWVEDDMGVAVFNAMATSNKVPNDDDGVAIIENEVRASLARAVSRGIFRANPEPVVTVPLVASVATADRAARLLPDVSWSAQLAGAIHKVSINGVVSV